MLGFARQEGKVREGADVPYGCSSPAKCPAKTSRRAAALAQSCRSPQGRREGGTGGERDYGNQRRRNKKNRFITDLFYSRLSPLRSVGSSLNGCDRFYVCVNIESGPPVTCFKPNKCYRARLCCVASAGAR